VTSSTRDSAHRHLVDAALAEAERRGFRLAVLGWAGAMTAIAVFYFVTISGPNSIKVPAVAIALACIGLAPLVLVGRRGERAGRFAFFAFNVLVVSGLLAVVPISSSGDVPQNFVFFSSRQHYYYVVVAVSVLTLSPALVLWTGLCAVAGLAGATAWMRDATILFADIEGFTRLSERLSAPQVIGLLNGFFDAAATVIEQHGGIVVNHVGDALIAAFNAPLPVEDHAVRAVDAARALQSLVAGRDFDGHRLRLRVGIATGPVAAGTVGGETRQTYTVYGDTVNVAQRLERTLEQGARDGLPDFGWDLRGGAIGLRRCAAHGFDPGSGTRGCH
jgi:hypothetical protein